MGRASDPKEHKEEKKFEASQRAAQRLLKKMGVKLEQLDRWCEDPPDGDTFITEIRFKIGGGWDNGVLGIIRIDGAEGPRIAFHGGETLGEALVGLVNRLDNGSLKWKEDKPYDARKGNGTGS